MVMLILIVTIGTILLYLAAYSLNRTIRGYIDYAQGQGLASGKRGKAHQGDRSGKKDG